TDCAAPLACQTVACNGGKCEYSSASCEHGETCCPNTGKCQACCSNKQCGSASAPLCCAATGTCAACCADSDCASAVMPLAVPFDGGTGGGGECSRPVCSAGTCTTETTKCPLGDYCCAGSCISQAATCIQPAR